MNSSPCVLKVSGISKQFQIGTYNSNTFHEDTLNKLKSYLKIGIARLTGNEAVQEKTALRSFWALRDVSFEVTRGEVFGIIGTNGSGKSTLLKILSRITKPTLGEAIIDDHLVSMLEVGTGFHPELTGRENIYLSGALIGMSKAAIDDRFEDIVSFSGVEKFIDTPVKRYSSGMYVRLAFSVTTQLVSEIILIDEVLAVGDADFQRKSLAKIDEMRQRGKTIILVSHNLFTLEQLCDRVMWLEGGRVKDIDRCKKVIRNYLNQQAIPSGSRVFPEGSDSNGAHIVMVSTSYDDHVSAAIPYDKSITVTIEYQVDYSIDGLSIGCRIWNHMNAPILNTTTQRSTTSNHGELGTPGRKSITVEIPQAWLAPAEYFLELGIWSPDVEHHHHVIKALSFKVVPAAGQADKSQAFSPDLQWDLRPYQ